MKKKSTSKTNKKATVVKTQKPVKKPRKLSVSDLKISKEVAAMYSEYPDKAPTEDFNPFAGNVPEMPVVPDEFYIEELCFWLGMEVRHSKTYLKEQNKDYLLKGDSYPPEPIYARDITGLLTVWEPIKDFTFNSYSSSKPLVYNSDGKAFLFNILKVAKEQPTLLIDAFARQLSIDKYLESNRKQTEKATLMKLVVRLNEFLENDDDQLIPPLYNSRRHGLLMSHDYRTQTMDSTFGDKVYEFGFSKITSDNFTKELLNILKTRRALISTLEDGKDIAVIDDEVIDKKNYGAYSVKYILESKEKLEITTAQLYLLFDFLSDHGVMFKSLTNVSKGKLMYYIAGLDAEKARQNISKLANKKTAGNQKTDLMFLRDKLSEIIKAIEKEIKTEA
jgi:hypothetical protein